MHKKILCIDDDPIALLLSKLVISKFDIPYELVTHPNGKVAFDYLEGQLEQQGKDNESMKLLILLDLNMPVMDGWEFLEQFRSKLYKSYSDTKIVLLSSSIDPNDIQKSKDFEMVMDFFPKPLTREMLSDILAKVKF